MRHSTIEEDGYGNGDLGSIVCVRAIIIKEYRQEDSVTRFGFVDKQTDTLHIPSIRRRKMVHEERISTI